MTWTYILYDPSLAAALLRHRQHVFIQNHFHCQEKPLPECVFPGMICLFQRLDFTLHSKKNPILSWFLSGSLSGGGRCNRLKPQGVFYMLAECSRLLTWALCTKQHGYTHCSTSPPFLFSTHWLLLLRSVSWMPLDGRPLMGTSSGGD